MATSRRLVGGLISTLIVFVGLVVVWSYTSRHFHRSHSTTIAPNVHVERAEPTALGPGDVRIYNVDTTVDLLLAGNSIFAGLSPKMVDKIKAGLDSSAAGDSTGLGGSISRIVKQSIGGAIGTHAVYPVSDIRDVRYSDGQIVFDWKSGGHRDVFSSTRVNGRNVSRSFREEDAKQFIDAVHARMGAPDDQPNPL